MYIPSNVTEVIYKERVESLLAQRKRQRNRNRFSFYQRVQAFIRAKKKRDISFASMFHLVSRLKLVWKWHLTMPQADSHLACDTQCED